MNTIEVRGAVRHYGPVRAVDGVDLAVAPGEALGLIGHNGAGKTTLFRLMLGLERPTAGTIEIAGIPVLGARFRDVRRRIGYMPESTSLYPNLTGRETLRFFAMSFLLNRWISAAETVLATRLPNMLLNQYDYWKRESQHSINANFGSMLLLDGLM